MALRWLYGLVPYSVKGGVEGSDGSGNGRKATLFLQRDDTKPTDAPKGTAVGAKPNPGALSDGGLNGGSDIVL